MYNPSVGLVDTEAVRDELVLRVVGRLDNVLIVVLALIDAFCFAVLGAASLPHLFLHYLLCLIRGLALAILRLLAIVGLAFGSIKADRVCDEVLP